MNFLNFCSSSSSEETPVVNAYELKARGKDADDDEAADDSHSVSSKHLQGYLDEYAYRYNHRKDERPMFLTMLYRVSAPRLGG